LAKAAEAQKKLPIKGAEPLFVEYRFKLESPVELPFFGENCPDSEQNSVGEEDFPDSFLPRF